MPSRQPSALRRLRTVLRPLPLACLGGAAVLTGCTGMLSTRAIEQFQTHLEAKDLQKLAASTTDRFRESALPEESALGTFDLLDVPIGKVTITEVRDTSPSSREVDVVVGGGTEKVTYTLHKKPDTLGRSKWLVDEITMRQGAAGSAVTSTVTDQMSLLLGVRDVVRLWQAGDPEKVAANATGELQENLAGVPDVWRRQLADRFFGGVLKSRPRAKLIDGQAQVELSHKEGRLKLVLDEGEDRWRVRTAVLVGRDKEIAREARVEAATLAAVSGFLKAYTAGERDGVRPLASERFYKNALSVADFTDSPLDAEAVLAAEYALRPGEETTELTVALDAETHQFTVVPKGEIGRERCVDEVTTYNGGETRRLSAALLTRPTVDLFAKSYAAADAARLKHLTSRDWKPLIWENCTGERTDVLFSLPLPPLEFNPADPEDAPTVRFNGPSVEVRQVTADAIVSYRLNASGGRVLVDDVEVIDIRGVMRLRDRLAVAVAIDQAADAILTGEIEQLRDACTDAMNRLVWDWSTPEDLPPALDLIPHLKSRVLDVMAVEGEYAVTLGQDRPTVRLILTGERPRIEEVIFLDESGVEADRLTHAARVHRNSAY